MKSKRKTYNPEEKANIVLEVLREESTLNEIVQKYEVQSTTDQPVEVGIPWEYAGQDDVNDAGRTH